MAINPISKAAGIPILGGVGNKDFTAMNDYAYQLWSTSEDEGRFLANVLKANRLMKVAVLTAQDDWPVAVSNALRARVKSNNGGIVYDQEYIPSESDFRTAIAGLKRKEPDVVFANLAINQLAPFFKQARELKVESVIYSNFWAAKKDVINAAGEENIEDVKFVEMNTALPSFQKTIAEKFRSTPSGATLSAYAGTLLLLQVVAKHPEANSSSSFNEALSKMREIETPDGPLTITDRRVEFPLIERTIRSGKAW
jgi:ABC-type branched-subunit amino acid transport system substrate-binding protein